MRNYKLILTTSSYSNITRELILCDWPKMHFNPQKLASFYNLENITMFNNNFTEFVDEFPYLKKLKVCMLCYSRKSSINPKHKFQKTTDKPIKWIMLCSIT